MLIPMFILVIAIILMGIFPWQISDKIMIPAARNLWDITSYVMTLMGGG